MRSLYQFIFAFSIEVLGARKKTKISMYKKNGINVELSCERQIDGKYSFLTI